MEPVGDRLVEALGHEHRAHRLQPPLIGRRERPEIDRRQRRGERVVADGLGELLVQVRRVFHIPQAVRRHDDADPARVRDIAGGRHLDVGDRMEPVAPQPRDERRVRLLPREEPPRRLRVERDGADRVAPRRHHAGRSHDLPARGRQPRRHPPGPAQRRREVAPALEPRRRVGVDPQRARGLAHRHRVERRRLQQDRAGVLGGLGLLAADHAGDGEDLDVVRDHERALGHLDRLRREQGPCSLAGARAPHDDRALDRVGVEGVRGLAQLLEDGVGGVDDRVDRIEPARREQP